MATTDPSLPPGAPVDPSQAQGAQIPLLDFNLPAFPPEAAGLKALTLTSDIKLDDYQSLLSQPFTIPPLPSSIESLTLELFSLGYPAGFLAQLAARLPQLKSVVVYSQLFSGISDESQADAVEFFKGLRELRALHLLDVFAKANFFRAAGPWLRYNTSDVEGEARRGLMFLEVNYTYRHEDADFLHRVQATELPDLIGPGLISCSFNISLPDAADNEDEQDPTTIQGGGGKEGIMAFNKSIAPDPVSALTKEEISPQGLRALNLTMYTLTLENLEEVLEKQKHLMVLNVTLEVSPGEEFKKKLIKVLEKCENLEQVEVVAFPTLEFYMNVRETYSIVLLAIYPSC